MIYNCCLPRAPKTLYDRAALDVFVPSSFTCEEIGLTSEVNNWEFLASSGYIPALHKISLILTVNVQVIDLLQ